MVGRDQRRMRKAVRMTVAAVTVLAGVLAPATGASAASIWSPLSSGTTQDITAIDYQSPTRFWFVTGGGQLWYRASDGVFQQGRDAAVDMKISTTQPFADVDFQETGTIGYAVGSTGNLWRSLDGGAHWTFLAPKTRESDDCTSDTVTRADKPLTEVDLSSITWASDDTVYITGDDLTVLKSTNADEKSPTFTEVNKPKQGKCKMYSGTPGSDFSLTDSVFLDENTGYFINNSFGTVFFTNTGLDAAAVKSKGHNGFNDFPKLAIDHDNPNRIWDANRRGQNTRSLDGAVTWAGWDARNGSDDLVSTYDIAFAGGSLVAAGDDAMIITSIDGTNFYHQRAEQTTSWRSVDASDAAHAAVGGEGGALVVTEQLNTIPEQVKPTGSIAGPDSVQVNQAATFTAQLADDHSGASGIDPNGTSWTVSGPVPEGCKTKCQPATLPAQSGASATYAFPTAGSWQVKVTFRDHAGNTNTAVKSVQVLGPPPPPPPAPPVASFATDRSSRPTARQRKGKVVVKVRGKVTAPGTRSCAGKVRITVSKGKKRLARRTVKVKPRTCGYKKTVKIKRAKVGKTKRLKVVLSFLPADRSQLSPTRVSYATRVR